MPNHKRAHTVSPTSPPRHHGRWGMSSMGCCRTQYLTPLLYCSHLSFMMADVSCSVQRCMHVGNKCCSGTPDPTLDKLYPGSALVPNNVEFSASAQFQLLMGANGSGKATMRCTNAAASPRCLPGKSTYLQQVATIVIMAHAGSYVPASRASIRLFDKLLTRVRKIVL